MASALATLRSSVYHWATLITNSCVNNWPKQVQNWKPFPFGWFKTKQLGYAKSVLSPEMLPIVWTQFYRITACPADLRGITRKDRLTSDFYSAKQNRSVLNLLSEIAISNASLNFYFLVFYLRKSASIRVFRVPILLGKRGVHTIGNATGQAVCYLQKENSRLPLWCVKFGF